MGTVSRGSRARLSRAVKDASGPSKRMRNVSISTILILILAGVAAVAYYFGTPTSLPPANVSTDACSPLSVQITIPQGVGTNSSVSYEPPALRVVVGVNNTVIWNDKDTTAPHNVISVSVPPNAQQWYIDEMTGGNTYCVTLTVPGTYTYELALNYEVEGTIVVKG